MRKKSFICDMTKDDVTDWVEADARFSLLEKNQADNPNVNEELNVKKHARGQAMNKQTEVG